MTKKFPDHPKNPERVCWGCDAYCAASDMRCGNGSDRTPHPAELFGDDWRTWNQDEPTPARPPVPATSTPSATPAAPDNPRTEVAQGNTTGSPCAHSARPAQGWID